MGARVRELVVEAGGEKRLIRCDFNAMCTAEEVTGKSYMGGSTGQWRDIRALLYGALVSGARKNGELVDFTPEDVGDWMQDVVEGEQTLAGLFLEVWADFQPEEEEEGGAEDPPTVESASA